MSSLTGERDNSRIFTDIPFFSRRKLIITQQRLNNNKRSKKKKSFGKVFSPPHLAFGQLCFWSLIGRRTFIKPLSFEAAKKKKQHPARSSRLERKRVANSKVLRRVCNLDVLACTDKQTDVSIPSPPEMWIKPFSVLFFFKHLSSFCNRSECLYVSERIKAATCSPSVNTLFSKLQEMVGVGSPEASQVRVTCSSNSDAVWLLR